MCAIVDSNIVSELWEQGGNPAGRGFRNVIDKGRLPLAFGGSNLKQELTRMNTSKPSRTARWIQQLQVAGRLISVSDREVDERTQDLLHMRQSSVDIRSNDHHILALAQVSGARLLYTNDQHLTEDFRNAKLINKPRGRVYNTRLTSDFNKQRRLLLERDDLCARSKTSH
ncbi:MAG: hypothetical protein OXI96_06535 [Acidimicrobiaceae bacterium]|nr:hypothetical protein [Acidimicrobiaceae bacterium]